MPITLAPFLSFGPALLALLVAIAFLLLFKPLLDGMGARLPVIGGYFARAGEAVLAYALERIAPWAQKGVPVVVGFFNALSNVWGDNIAAVNAFVVELPGALSHFRTAVLPHLIDVAIAPVRTSAHDAKLAVDALPDGINDVFSKPLRDFVGIEHGVQSRLDQLLHELRSIDLADLKSDVEGEIATARDQVLGGVLGLGDYVDHEFGRVWDQLGKLPLQAILDQLALLAGTAALVDLIAREGGLDNAECRNKVRGICSTDPDAWQALLDVAGFALEWVGIAAFVELLQDFTREALPQVIEMVYGD